jgi:hypothetical protein
MSDAGPPPNTAPGGDEAADEALASKSRSTHFDFKHRLFQGRGTHFAISPATDEPVLNLSMGDLNATLTIPTLANEFNLGPDTHDGRLLRVITKSLRFVKIIRPGDSIPSEILDGSSSWMVESHHQTTAISRLSFYLVNRAEAHTFEANEFQILSKMANDEETKNKVSDTLVEIARSAGKGRETKEAIFELLEQVARELAYIEALRERYGKIKMIEKKIAEAGKLYRRERAVSDDVSRIQALIKGPLSEFPSIFKMVYTQMADVRMVLRSVPAQVQFIRTMRDELSVRFMKWEEMIQLWEMIPPERGEMIERALRLTYRFMARHFPQRSEWSLTIAKT